MNENIHHCVVEQIGSFKKWFNTTHGLLVWISFGKYFTESVREVIDSDWLTDWYCDIQCTKAIANEFVFTRPTDSNDMNLGTQHCILSVLLIPERSTDNCCDKHSQQNLTFPFLATCNSISVQVKCISQQVIVLTSSPHEVHMQFISLLVCPCLFYNQTWMSAFHSTTNTNAVP